MAIHAKTWLFGLLSILFLALLTGCNGFGTIAKGNLETKTFDEKDFSGLVLSLPATVEVTIDSVFKIEVTVEENVLPFVETRVKNGVLTIDFDRPVLDVDGAKIKISAPSWDFFEVDGSGKIHVLAPISGDLLKLEVSGSGDFLVDKMDFKKTEIDISGSGSLDLTGSGDELFCEISGSGDVRCLDFLVKKANVGVSGSGDIQLSVSENLDAKISGSGTIEYRGDPTISVHVSGSGKVRKI